MFKHFLSLEFKSFFRSASLGKSIALKIFLGFMGLYFALSFLGLGFLLFDIIKEKFPNKNPFYEVQRFVGVWFICELFLRFMMQTLPVINMKSFLTLNIKKTSIIHYVLLKSIFSFYNLIALLIAVPFVIISLSKNAIPTTEAITWLLCIIALVLTINYSNFLIKKSFEV